MNLEFGSPFHHKNIDQCRIIGRIGGVRSGQSRRLRKLAQPPTPIAISPEPQRETAHQASLLLDSEFPWLKGAWLRRGGRPTA